MNPGSLPLMSFFIYCQYEMHLKNAKLPGEYGECQLTTLVTYVMIVTYSVHAHTPLRRALIKPNTSKHLQGWTTGVCKVLKYGSVAILWLM